MESKFRPQKRELLPSILDKLDTFEEALNKRLQRTAGDFTEPSNPELEARMAAMETKLETLVSKLEQSQVRQNKREAGLLGTLGLAIVMILVL